MSDHLTTLSSEAAMPEVRRLARTTMPISSANPLRQIGWCVLEQAQDVRIVDRGYDATFFTRWGPPSCRPV